MHLSLGEAQHRTVVDGGWQVTHATPSFAGPLLDRFRVLPAAQPEPRRGADEMPQRDAVEGGGGDPAVRQVHDEPAVARLAARPSTPNRNTARMLGERPSCVSMWAISPA